MSKRVWTDRIVGDRMKVDREFSERIAQSSFSRHQWGLIMTATELKIDRVEDDEDARLVADASNLEYVADELARMEIAGRDEWTLPSKGSRGSIVDSVKSILGLDRSGRIGRSRLDEAERLTQEYADRLQRHLEERGKWERVRRAAAEDDE